VAGSYLFQLDCGKQKYHVEVLRGPALHINLLTNVASLKSDILPHFIIIQILSEQKFKIVFLVKKQ